MEILGLPPGREVGRAYNYLLELRMEHGPLGTERATAELLRWAGRDPGTAEPGLRRGGPARERCGPAQPGSGAAGQPGSAAGADPDSGPASGAGRPGTAAPEDDAEPGE